MIVHGFLQGYAARKGGPILHRRVLAVVGQVHRPLGYPGRLQHVAQAHPGPLAAGHRPANPLGAAHSRGEHAPAVAGAFQQHLHGDLRQALQILQGKCPPLADLPVDDQLPVLQILAPGALGMEPVLRTKWRMVGVTSESNR